jgi:hypothetical protein
MLLEAALTYHRRGWCIIPVRGKKAACRWKAYQKKRPAESRLRGWFGQPRGVTGLAVVLGPVSGGLACRDFDTVESYRRWAAAHPGLAATLPTVETRRGFHVYFLGPEGFTEFDDGEYRADSGHYCLLPPSRHPGGGQPYRWVVPLPAGPLPAIDPVKEGLCCGATEIAESSGENRDTGDSAGKLMTADDMGVCGAVEDAIRATMPSGPGQRNRMIFALCRRLKALPHLADADPGELRDVIQRWHQLALPAIRTKPFEETYIDFLRAWPKVKHPAGSGPLADLFQRASAAPPPSVATGYEQEGLRLLVSLCRELHRAADPGPFFLGCRTAGTLLGVDHTTAWRWLFLLKEDGVLELVSIGSQSTHKASRYRYVAGD